MESCLRRGCARRPSSEGLETLGRERLERGVLPLGDVVLPFRVIGLCFLYLRLEPWG